MKSIFTSLIVFLFLCSTSFSQWEQIPLYNSGNVKCISYKGKDLFAGVSMSGIYKSDDKGLNWERMTNIDNIDWFKYNNLIPNEILIKNNNILVTTNHGFYKSTDYGVHWKNSNNGFDSAGSNSLFVFNLIENNEKIYVNCNGRMYYSEDLGENWTPFIKTMRFYIRNDTIVNYFNDLFISYDFGENWEKVADFNQFIDNDIKCINLVKDKIYLGTLTNLFVYSKKEENWEQTLSYIFQEGVYHIKFYKNNLYFQTITSLYVSTDYLESYDKISPSIEFGKSINDFLIVNGEIFLATSNEIFYSSDNGSNWEVRINGINYNYIFDIELINDKLLTSTYNNGMFTSTNPWENWEQILIDSLKSISDIKYFGNKIYIRKFVEDKIYYSEDYENWKEIKLNVSVNNAKKLKSFLPVSNGIIVKFNYSILGSELSYDSLFISHDLGETWKVIKKPNDDEFEIDTLQIYTFIEHNNNLFIHTNKGLFYTQDYGKKWYKKSDNDLSGKITKLVKSKGNMLYFLTTSNDLYAYFMDSFINLTDIIPKAVIINDFEFGEALNIYLATQNGFYYTENYGNFWYQYNSGLINKYINKVKKVDDYLFLTTANGLYKLKIDRIHTDVNDNIEHTFNYLYTYPPYPTPSTDHVNILTYFDITQPFDLSKVYVTDIYGAKVSTEAELSFEPQTNYKGVITWDCSSHPDGVYFIIISHGTTKKAVKVMVGR